MTDTPKLDPRDRILQAHTPAIMVPRHGKLALLDKPSHRFLVASDGIWIEVLRPWLHARVQISQSEIPLPFGDVGQVLTYAFGRTDLQRIEQRFIEDAALAFPNECAAWGVYDEWKDRLYYRSLEADEASPTGVTFKRPALADHLHLAIDIHSHGALPAGFSGTDDEDDAGEVKLSIVVGDITAELSYARRLCLHGLFVDQDDEGTGA